MLKPPTPRAHDVLEVPLTSFRPGKFQYRQSWNEAEMESLTASIKDHGVEQAILLRDVLDGRGQFQYTEIVYGHRRTECARRAGLKTVPAKKKILSDVQAAQLALEENMQRENPSDWDTALGMKNLMEAAAADGKPMNPAQLARHLNRSLTYVNNHLNLFKLHPKLQEAAQRNDAVRSSLFEIQKVANTEHLDPLIRAVDNGASYKAIETLVAGVKAMQSDARETSKAPDSETQSRSSDNARTGGGNVSRGRRVTGSNATEAKSECARAIGQLKAWMPYLSRIDRERVKTELAKLGGSQ